MIEQIIRILTQEEEKCEQCGKPAIWKLHFSTAEPRSLCHECLQKLIYDSGEGGD